MAKTTSRKLAAEVGVGALAAAALAVAGGYVLWEKMGKDKQKKVKAWVAKARKEAVQKLAQAKKIGETEYKRIVDTAVERYGSMAHIDKAELKKTAAILRSEWKRIKSEAKQVAAEAKKRQETAATKGKKATVRKQAKRRA